MQKILSKREKLILFATVGVIVFGVIYNFIIEPFLSKDESLNREINLNKSKLKKYAYLLSRKDDIRSKYNRLSQNLKRSEAGEDAFVNALTAIEEIAKASNVRLLDIRPQSQRSQEIDKEILIELRTEGSVENYLRFLYNLENSLSLLWVKKFQLNSKANTQNLGGNFSISQPSLN